MINCLLPLMVPSDSTCDKLGLQLSSHPNVVLLVDRPPPPLCCLQACLRLVGAPHRIQGKRCPLPPPYDPFRPTARTFNDENPIPRTLVIVRSVAITYKT